VSPLWPASLHLAHGVVLHAGSVLAIRVPGGGAELPCDARRAGEPAHLAALRALRLHVGAGDLVSVAELCETAVAPGSGAPGARVVASAHLFGLGAAPPSWLGVAVAWVSPLELLESPNQDFHRALLLQLARRGILPGGARP
jgi:hypothetical protein